MGISADEAARIVAAIAEYLRGVERYSVMDVRNLHTGVERIDFYIWQAEQLLWDVERIAFAPVHLWPMHRERVRDAGRLARRAEKQRARGTRAFRRAEDKLRHASSMTDNGKDAERFREMADRIRLKLALRAGDR